MTSLLTITLLTISLLTTTLLTTTLLTISLLTISLKKTINCKGQLLSLQTPKIMGILNVTPDSFYDGGKFIEKNIILQQAEKMLLEGADILDIGGYSTRPNAENISENEELDRVLPNIEAIIKNFPDAIISVDTFRANVAKEAIKVGASIINDISGGNLDENMFQTMADLNKSQNIPYVLMHTRGTPKTMTQLADYEDILLDLVAYFQQKIYQLQKLGIKDIIIDLGFGFAKNVEQNFFLLKNLSYFEILEKPILVGISRKSMIYKTLQITPQNSLNGTTALNMAALMNGASFLRVHDVAEANETRKLFLALNT